MNKILCCSCCWSNNKNAQDVNLRNNSVQMPRTITQQPKVEEIIIRDVVHTNFCNTNMNVNQLDSSPIKFGIEESSGFMCENSPSSHSFDSTTDESSDDSMHHQHIIGSYIIRSHLANIHRLRVTDV